MSVGNRIRSLRRSLNLSQPALAKKSKVGQSTISDLENDKKGTSAEAMEAIAQALGTTTTYLITGNGAERTTDIASVAGNISKNLINKDKVVVRYFKDLPISCGDGSFGEVLERNAEPLEIDSQPLRERGISTDNCIVLPATGHSMYPTIKDKDLVYVDLGRNTIKDGKVFAVFHGGLFKFKRLYQLPLGGVRIVSDNAVEYPEEKLSFQDVIDQQFEVIGWAWSWQSMESW